MLKLSVKRYALALFVCCAVLLALMLGAAYLWFPAAFSWKTGLMAAVFFAVGVAAVAWLKRVSAKGQRAVLGGFMAMKGARMLILFAFLLVMLILYRDSVKWMAAEFAVFYIAILVFDTVYLKKHSF